MKKKSPIRAVIIILLITAGIVLLVRDFRIDHLYTVCPGTLYTSGQPRGMDYTRLLYKYHIRTIINLRAPTEHREHNWYHEETTWTRDNGIKYVEMPLGKNIHDDIHFPDADMQQRFLGIMADKTNLPVLVHDGRGKSRVATFAAVWLAKDGKNSVEQVLKTAEKIKTEPLIAKETEFIRGLFPSDANAN
jgi:protein tyrosine/serine phosphatase